MQRVCLYPSNLLYSLVLKLKIKYIKNVLTFFFIPYSLAAPLPLLSFRENIIFPPELPSDGHASPRGEKTRRGNLRNSFDLCKSETADAYQHFNAYSMASLNFFIHALSVP